jgi:hypothetical protein
VSTRTTVLDALTHWCASGRTAIAAVPCVSRSSRMPRRAIIAIGIVLVFIVYLVLFET